MDTSIQGSRPFYWASPSACLFLVLLELTTPILMLNGQEFGQSSRQNLIDELLSIEEELSRLRIMQLKQNSDLKYWQENSENLYTNLNQLKQELMTSQEESEKLSRNLSQLNRDLEALRREYENSGRGWNLERMELSKQIESVTAERNSAARSKRAARWLGRAEGAGIGVIILLIAAAVQTISG